MKNSNPIIIACKEAPERLPPILSLLAVVAEMFSEVYLVTNRTSDGTRETLRKQGVTIIEACPDQVVVTGSSSALGKIRSWYSFRMAFWNLRARIGCDAFLWIATADSALAIGKRLLKERYVLGLLELYDTQKIYLSMLKPFVQHAGHTVTPEICRSAIFRVWFNLPYTPTVIPNKPVGLDVRKGMPIVNAEARRKVEAIGNRKLLLYQARMVRMEMFDIAESIKRSLGDEYVLGILGEIRDKEMFARLNEFYPALVHFDYLRPPEHLAVTSHAYIGLLIYNYESLNNIFCAPNKVWEYGAVSLPMISHELPMLSEQLRYFKAGETFSTGDPDSVTKAVRAIEGDYSAYSRGARSLYQSVDVKEMVSSVIEKCFISTPPSRKGVV